LSAAGGGESLADIYQEIAWLGSTLAVQRPHLQIRATISSVGPTNCIEQVGQSENPILRLRSR